MLSGDTAVHCNGPPFPGGGFGGSAGWTGIDAYITLNGQYCYEGTPGRPVIYKHPIPRSQIAILLKILEETPFPCLFMEAENWYLNYVDERVIRFLAFLSIRSNTVQP